MTEPLSETDQIHEEGPACWEWWTAIALLVVPLVGIAAHAVLYYLASEGAVAPASVRAYVFGWGTKAVAALAILCVVGNWVHYRRTRMRLDVASRIAAYLWILSIVLLLRAVHTTR